MKQAEKKQIKTKIKHIVVWQQFDLKNLEIWTTAKFFSHKKHFKGNAEYKNKIKETRKTFKKPE